MTEPVLRYQQPTLLASPVTSEFRGLSLKYISFIFMDYFVFMSLFLPLG